jgi:hypothetical protein
MRLLIASLVLLTTAGAAGAVVSPPHLQIEGKSPLVVAGRGFGPSEQITLRVSGGNVPRHLHADADGSFHVRLTSLRTFRCVGLIVVASSASGRVASAHLPRPACMTPHGDTTK